MKPIKKPTEGKRYKIDYRGENCYIVLCEDSLDISMPDPHDRERQETVAGLEFIAGLITVMREYEIPWSVVERTAMESSRSKLDIPGKLFEILNREGDE